MDVSDTLTGQGEELLALVRNYATPQQWAAWLRVPLGSAAAEGNAEMVDLLVAAGADAGPGHREDGATLLHAAAEGGSKHILQVFLDSGCKSDLDCRENNGSQLSALHVAAEEGHSRATGALIRAGATVHLTDGDGRTPLHCAALHGHGNVVVDLLLNGADKEAEDEEGSRPLHLAVEGGHREALKLLLRAGANPNSEQRLTGRRPLYIAALGGHHKLMRELIEKGADKDACTNCGRGRSGAFTALHAAAELGGVDAISILVEAGADLEVPSDHMSTALHLAASGGAVDSVAALLHAGANMQARDSAGNTPLHNGCRFLWTDVVRVLVDWGADKFALDDAGLRAQDVLGMRIKDGAEGKEDRIDAIRGILGCVVTPPASPVAQPPVSVVKGIAPQSVPCVGLFSFSKLSSICNCIGVKYQATK